METGPQGLGLKPHPTDWSSMGLNLQHVVYKVSTLSTTPQRLLDFNIIYENEF